MARQRGADVVAATRLDAAVGEALTNARRAAGQTRAALARRLGVPAATVARYETGRASVPVTQLTAIAAALDADPVELLAEAVADAHLPGHASAARTTRFVRAVNALPPAQREPVRRLVISLGR